ncbi:fasciclin domain-containing protein [Roseateles sp. GG27B]
MLTLLRQLLTLPHMHLMPDSPVGWGEAAAAAHSNSRFEALLVAADMASLLNGRTELSLLVPLDQAITDWHVSLGLRWDELLCDTPRLHAMLLGHVLPAALSLDALSSAALLITANGSLLHVQAECAGAARPALSLLGGNGDRARHLSSHPLGRSIVHRLDAVLRPAEHNLAQMLGARPELSLLAEAMRLSGLDSLLGCAGPFTLLAPLNDGMEHLAARLGLGRSALFNDTATLRSALQHQLLAGRYSSGELPWGSTLHSLQGRPLHLNHLGLVSDGLAALPLLPGSDQSASNGVLHLIAQPLIHMH